MRQAVNKVVEIPSLDHSGLISLNDGGVWKKVFTVIKDGAVAFYSDKESCKKYPHQMIKGGKPIELEDYVVRVKSEKPPFYFTLAHHYSTKQFNKNMEFLCDSLKEAKEWIDAFRRAVSIARMIEERGVKVTADWAIGDARRSLSRSSMSSVAL
jgi:hypothetical protein